MQLAKIEIGLDSSKNGSECSIFGIKKHFLKLVTTELAPILPFAENMKLVPHVAQLMSKVFSKQFSGRVKGNNLHLAQKRPSYDKRRTKGCL